jgi:hypothetical protein
MLELIGVLSVPVQGFPIARAAMAASASGEYVSSLLVPFAQPDPDDATVERKLRVLFARSLGAAALAELAAGPVDATTLRMRRTLAAQAIPPVAPEDMPESETETEFKNTSISITVNVNGGESEPEEAIVIPPALRREVALQIDYMRDHGVYSDTPLSDGALSADDFAFALECASELVEHPESARSQLLVGQLRQAGYLVSSVHSRFASLRAAG